MNTCIWVMEDESLCGEMCEGRTSFCGSHNRTLRREAETSRKQSENRAALLEKAKNQKPKKGISRNPKDWSNTFLMSNGERITQYEINQNLSAAYSHSAENNRCVGCGAPKTCHAHIIPQSRCKHLGKTELIWDFGNWFDSCYNCNASIENPKGKEWKTLKNIHQCLQFIHENDKELFTKFELSAVNQEKEII